MAALHSRVRAFAAAACALTASAAASASWPQLRVPHAQQRQLEEASEAPKNCRSVAMRLLPPPSIKAYEQCFKDKLRPDSSHDWSVPGAEVDAQLKCWCKHNLTATMEEYGCCNHDDVFPMCSVKCDAPCDSALAQQCVKSCPPMCFEAAEYVVDRALCKGCDWVKCWPVLKCLNKHAGDQVQSGSLARTCHETDFRHRPELENYWQCWKHAPKHSTHWNVLSSIVNCICREGMQVATKNTSCCDSVLYGGGACELECLPEKECVTQIAQTCINNCQLKCPSMQITPTTECMNDCLDKDAPCRKYISCRANQQPRFICDDGLWPEANSGCCVDNVSRLVGCPKLCESERIWRLDRRKGVPWWARRYNGPGIVAQCSCKGCPFTESEGRIKMKQTLEESLWDNGQIMLVDIARRMNLSYGPNRRMQELMAARNSEIMKVMKMEEVRTREQDRRISAINDFFSKEITEAALLFPDESPRFPKLRGDEHMPTVIVVIACTAAVLAGVGAATFLILRKSKVTSTNITAFQQGDHVVVGNPVAPNHTDAQGTVYGGTPVTLTAPMKESSKPALS